jgi:tetratricopeptide (TPR) repeat protein
LRDYEVIERGSGAGWPTGLGREVRGVVTGLVVDGAGFEVLAADERVGSRRRVDGGDVELLTGLAGRYARAVRARSGQGVLASIGRELYQWLDGGEGQLAGLVERAPRPLVFEVRGERAPSDAGWAVLRAPWELLAVPGGGGFLAEDALVRFCVVRRLGAPVPPAGVDGFRLGLAFMACAPRRQSELDFEGEEAAILAAVGETGVDLLVEDTGDPRQLAGRLAGAGGMPVVHLSCHGLNNWRTGPGAVPVPVLMMEDETGGDLPVTAGELPGLLTGGAGGGPRLVFVSACLTATGADTPDELPSGAGAKGAGTPDEMPPGADATGARTPGEMRPAADPTGTGTSGEMPPGANAKGADTPGPLTSGANTKGTATPDGTPPQADTTGTDTSGGVPPGADAKGAGTPDALSSATGARGAGGGVLPGSLVSHSLATALVSAGVPAVIGWDGSVIDQAATMFAAELYRRLAQRADLAVAAGDARRAVLGSEDHWVRGEWHLARVWLGPDGGGALVAGNRRRSLVPATRGTRVFLDLKGRVPVAAPEMFVGRRLELQQALRVLREGRKAGVLLHGQGRLGKSSLAARIADRHPEYAVAVVYGDYGAMGVLDAISRAVQDNPVARELIASRLAGVRDRPESLEGLLAEVVGDACGQVGDGGRRPLLLIIDDLEQVLVADPAGPHRVETACARVLAGVLRAFDPTRTDSRLVVTSRFTFTVGGPEGRLQDVQLRPMSAVAQRKLQRRQVTLAPGDLSVQRAVLAERAVAVARGNPGLQDLAVLRLAYAGQVSDERAETAVAEMEDYLRQGDLPVDSEAREFLENLALDALLTEAGPSGVELLRATTMFSLPVPETVIEALAARVGGSPGRLRGLGLLSPSPDLYDPACTALAAEPLAAGRTTPLSVTEENAWAAVAAGPLFLAWGGENPDPPRDPDLDLQLTRLALLADDPDVTASAAVDAVYALGDGPAAEAFRLGQEAIGLLDRHGRPVPLLLLRRVASSALRSGDGAAGEALLERAAGLATALGPDQASLLDRARVLAEQAAHLITRGELGHARGLLDQALQLFTSAGSELEVAVAWGRIADITYQRGDLDEALRIRQEIQLPVYERLGDTRETAITWGNIADITYQRGDYDEALRIHHEIQLPAYERLGDTRSAAITWGNIADITYQRGDYDEAAGLQHKRLEVNRQLGAIDGIAAASWGLAQIDLAREDYESAFPRLVESYQLFGQLQRADGIAVVGWMLGQILAASGNPEEAREVLSVVQAAATKVGMTELVRLAGELLGQLSAAMDDGA